MIYINLSSIALLFVNFSLLFRSVGAAKVWIDPECSSDVHDALMEALWNSGQTATALYNRDIRWQEPLKWMFNVDYTTRTAGGQLYVDWVADTYFQIGTLLITLERLTAAVRIYCDDDGRYRALDGRGNYLPVNPPNTDPNFDSTRFYDVQNDSIVTGRNLRCKQNKEGSIPIYAHTVARLDENFNRLRGEALLHASTDLPERVTISICSISHPQHQEAKYYTWKQAARKDLHDIEALPVISINVAQTITHELVHCSVVSAKDFTLPSGGDDTVQFHREFGIDIHNGERGYYYKQDTQTPGERLKRPEFSIMNPDSYSYLATLFRMVGKRWDYRRDPNGFIKFWFNPSLLDVGDWPVDPSS